MTDNPNISVMHLDGLMSKIIRSAGMKHPGYKEDDNGDKVAQVALEALKSWRGDHYHAVLLDEAQDFGTNALKFALSLLLDPNSGDFIIVADSPKYL